MRSNYSQIAALLVYGTIWLSMAIGNNDRAGAQSSLAPPPTEICDLDLALLKSGQVSRDRNIITADTVTSDGMTVPSLWWTSEQFPAKLIANWMANRRQQQIYLVVNTQYWNLLDYIERYRTISKFGRVAASYGYNLKICNTQKISLAHYTCESISPGHSAKPGKSIGANIDLAGTPTPNNCQIWLNVSGQNGIGVRTN